MKIGNGDNTDSRIYTAAADLRRRGPKLSAAAAFGAPIEFFGGGGAAKNSAARPARRSALVLTDTVVYCSPLRVANRLNNKRK